MTVCDGRKRWGSVWDYGRVVGWWCLGVVRLGYLVIDGVKLGEDDTIDGA